MIIFFFFFFPFSKVLPFRDLRISLVQKAEFLSCNLCVTVLLRFSSDVVVVCFFFPVAAKRIHTHISSVHSLAHATRSVGLPAPPHRGETGEEEEEVVVEDGCPIGERGGRLVGGDEPGSSALSPDIHT